MERAHSALNRALGHNDGLEPAASSANGLEPSTSHGPAHWTTVGRLTPGLIHEINNSLCVVGNHVQLLLLKHEACPELSGRGGGADLVKPLQVMNEYLDRAQAILHRFAEYATPLTRSPSRFHVSDLVEDALALAHLQRPLRRLHLRREFAEGPLEIEGDPNLVMDVCIELLTVAAHAIPCDGTLTIFTRSIRADDPAGPTPGGALIGFTGVGQWPHLIDNGLTAACALAEQLGGRLTCTDNRDATEGVSTTGPSTELRLRTEPAEVTGIWLALPQRGRPCSAPAPTHRTGEENGDSAEVAPRQP